MNDVTHPKTADEVAYEIEAAGRKAIALQANVSRAAEVQRIYAIGLGTIRTPGETSRCDTPTAYASLTTLPLETRRRARRHCPGCHLTRLRSRGQVTGATLFVDGGMTLYSKFATGG